MNHSDPRAFLKSRYDEDGSSENLASRPTKFEDSKQILKFELKRKAFHLQILFLPLLFFISGKKPFLSFLIPISALIVACDFSRLHYPKFNQFWGKIFGKIMRESELSGQKLSGLSSTLIAACIVFPFAKPVVSICAFVVLAISDSAAAIIGKSFPSSSFFEKSKNGSLAFFVSATLIVITFGLVYKCEFNFFVFGILVSAFVSVVEARISMFNFDDNFLIPVAFAAFLSGFDFVWNF